MCRFQVKVIAREVTQDFVTHVKVLVNPRASTSRATGVFDTNQQGRLLRRITSQRVLALETVAQVKSEVSTSFPFELETGVYRSQGDLRNACAQVGAVHHSGSKTSDGGGNALTEDCSAGWSRVNPRRGLFAAGDDKAHHGSEGGGGDENQGHRRVPGGANISPHES
jgi:hypothetical protein